MRFPITSLVAGLAVMLTAAPAMAQKPSASPRTPKEITLIGCVEMEKDYRARIGNGKGGPLGSGIGAENEYVLTNAKAASSPTGKGRAETVGTSGLAGDYSLTGKLESELKREIGRQVEVVGTVETIEAHHSASDAKSLPKFTVSLWHPVGDFCPANPK